MSVDLSEIETLLQNWGRWVRVRPGQGHCSSIEGRYRRKSRVDDTPEGWGAWLTTPPQQALPPIDERAALSVERCMRHLPRKHRLALKFHFVYKMPEKMICRRIAIHFLEWDEFRTDAKLMIANRLTSEKNKRSILQNSYLPA